MISIQREKWIDCIDQIMPLCQMVHEIVEQNLYAMPLDFDTELYEQSEQCDQFHCIVMRNNGKPIGFHWMVVYPLARFKGHKQAGTDAIFVHPDFRYFSKKLIDFSEQYAIEHGCSTWALATLDPVYRGDMWQKRGFQKAETIFIKKVTA